LRAYGWSDNHIERYKKLKEDEERNLLFLVDESVSAAMDELGDDLEKYLNDAGKDVFDRDVHKKFGASAQPKDKKKVKFRPAVGDTPLEPFVEIFKGVGELVGGLIPSFSFKKSKVGAGFNPSSSAAAAKTAARPMWQAYKNYKKAHQLLSW
ncbi:hypothetical protein GF367_01390, partial [Candidatus Woesearchaeota archaeon]|nr:hypothetical protein [Candidatus Woesearchaeota archaeon]